MLGFVYSSLIMYSFEKKDLAIIGTTDLFSVNLKLRHKHVSQSFTSKSTKTSSRALQYYF